MIRKKGSILGRILKIFTLIRIFKKNKNKVQDYTYQTLLDLLSFYKKEEGGNITESYLISNIISLRNKKAQDIMIPRVDIIALDEDIESIEILKIVQNSGFSRIPIYQDKLDNIKGFMHVKDLVRILRKKDDISLKSIVRPIIFISPYIKLLDLLYEMKSKRTHMAIIVDEFGGVDGLVTIEDIVEEIVGEIIDEHDKAPTNMMIVKKDGIIEADGRLELEELEKKIGSFVLEDEKNESNTLAGLIVSLVGYIPSNNEVIEHSSGVEFRVISADPVKINKVIVNYESYLKNEK